MASTIALQCGICGRFVTPCIVCARPIAAPPFQDAWIDCVHCGVRNPLNVQARETLHLPPPLALPLAMVRRMQISLIGRRAYLQTLSARKQSPEADFMLKGTLPFYLLEKEGVVDPVSADRDEIQDSEERDQPGDERTNCQGCGLISTLHVSQPTVEMVSPQELTRCNSQLLALICSQALAEDLKNRCSAAIEFPICRVSSTVTGTSMACGSVQTFTHFSLKLLQLANEALMAELAELKETVAELMTEADRFLSSKETLRQAQISKLRAEEAVKQAALDCRTPTMFPLLRSALTTLVADSLKEREESVKEARQEFSEVLSKINTVLQSFFLLASVAPKARPSSFSSTRDALTVATTYWLLLFHDIAHYGR